MNTTQTFHDRVVTRLMIWAMGDLQLDPLGDLMHRHSGNKLAIIGCNGWKLTGAGAAFILETECDQYVSKAYAKIIRAMAEAHYAR